MPLSRHGAIDRHQQRAGLPTRQPQGVGVVIACSNTLRSHFDGVCADATTRLAAHLHQRHLPGLKRETQQGSGSLAAVIIRAQQGAILAIDRDTGIQKACPGNHMEQVITSLVGGEDE